MAESARRATQPEGTPGACALLAMAVASAALACAAPVPAPRQPAYGRAQATMDVTAAPSAEPAVAAADEGSPRAPAPTSPDAANLEPVPIAEDDGGFPISGSVQLNYRGRRTDDATDHDLYAVVALDAGDAAHDAVTAHVMGRLWWDLGGNDDDDVFFGLEDTFGSSLSAILYYAYADLHEIDGLSRLRIGRQQVVDTPAFLVFDGVQVEAAEIGGVTLGAYGGLRAQYYDTSTPDDIVAGVYGSVRPWEGGRLRLDYMHLEDEERLGSDRDDLLGLELRQLLGEELTLEGEFTALEGDSRDLRLRAHWLDADSDLSLQATYYSLLQTQKSQALEVDPYFSSLLEYFPFHQLALLASKGLGESLTVDLGLDGRRLDDEDDVGPFNHEFERYYLSTVFHDLLLEGLEVTLTGDVWQDDQQDVQTWGVDATQQLTSSLQGSVGSYYSLFKYDLFFESERDDVRTYYVKARYASSSSLTLDMGFEYEDDDYEQYQTLRLGARWLF